VDSGGYLEVPDGPGLGRTVTLDALAARTIEEIVLDGPSSSPGVGSGGR
jgi:hypothetical protein